MKIADLIGNNLATSDRECDLLISGQESVNDVLEMMQSSDCQYVGIEHIGYEDTVVISKEELLSRLLEELNDSYQRVVELKKRVDESFECQTDVIQGQLTYLVTNENNKLSISIDYLQEGLVILDTDLNVERANPSAKQCLGLPNNCSIDLVHSELERLGFLALLNNDPTQNENNWGEYKVKNNNERILQLRWSDILASSMPLGKVLILKDVTDENADEKAKTEFIAAITHELRTPLTIIQNSVSNILAGVTGKINKKTKQYLNTILNDCHRFDGLIADLLDMSKIETGRMSITRKAVSIDLLIEEVMENFKDEASVKTIRIVFRCDEYVPVLCIDRDRISQVLSNLVSNAIKHSNNGETITIRVAERQEDVVVSIEDRGVGIAPDMQNEIFDKFSQIDRQAGAGYKGTGLGLAICKGIMTMHGGAIWVESEVGLGSKFHISMPKTDAWLVLNKCIAESAEQAKKAKSQFALASVEIKPIGEEPMTNGVVDDLIRKLIEQRDCYLTSKTDKVFRVSATELFFVLNETKKKQLFYKSLAKIINDNDSGLAGRAYECRFGSAVYPEDTGEILALENLARRQAAVI